MFYIKFLSFFFSFRKYIQNRNTKIGNAFLRKLLAYGKQKVTGMLLGRNCFPVSDTFHKAGIVVPYDRKTDIGYRPLSESECMLIKKLGNCVNFVF